MEVWEEDHQDGEDPMMIMAQVGKNGIISIYLYLILGYLKETGYTL